MIEGNANKCRSLLYRPLGPWLAYPLLLCLFFVSYLSLKCTQELKTSRMKIYNLSKASHDSAKIRAELQAASKNLNDSDKKIEELKKELNESKKQFENLKKQGNEECQKKFDNLKNEFEKFKSDKEKETSAKESKPEKSEEKSGDIEKKENGQ